MGIGYDSRICVGKIEPIWQSAMWENVSSNLVDLSNFCKSFGFKLTLYCLLFWLRYAAASTRDDGYFVLCGGRDYSGVV